MWTISVPIRVPVSKTKAFALNLNVYRNANFHTLNKAKVEFAKIVEGSLKGIPKQEQIRLTYTLFPATKTKLDTANVCSIVDKFLCDALVSAGVIEDDNHTVVLSVQYRYGSVRKGEPCVEVLIEPVVTVGEIA